MGEAHLIQAHRTGKREVFSLKKKKKFTHPSLPPPHAPLLSPSKKKMNRN